MNELLIFAAGIGTGWVIFQRPQWVERAKTAVVDKWDDWRK
jgi:hypothetical protein